MAGAEAFTLLAVVEAKDFADAAIEKIDGLWRKLTGTVKESAKSIADSSAQANAALLETASGADALDLASARVEGARARLKATTDEQAAAERELLAAQEQAAVAADGDTAATDRLAAAGDRLATASRAASAAQKDMTAAQKLQSDTAEAAAVKTAGAADATKKLSDESTKSSEGLSKVGKAGGLMALGIAAAGVVMVKAAGNFQDSTTHLVTDAGESQDKLKMVQAGILNIASATGASTSALSDAMYHVESAGYHAQNGLDVLRVASEGAKVGGADLETVAKTLTGTLNAYNKTGLEPTVSMMNQLIAAVGAGDMRMQDLASSLGNVAPLAAAAHIQFAEVGGAIATMTAQNMSAQQATQDLANTIRALQNPNNVAITEMQALGLNANDVAKNLGQRGLTGTLDLLTTAIAKHTKGGEVFISTLKNSQSAAQDAQIMLKSLPDSIQKVAQSFENGQVKMKDWDKVISQLPANQRKMAQQFATLVEKSNGFNQLLTSGSPAAETYNAALSKLLGGATGLNTALMLTGGRMQSFKDNVKTVADAAKKGGTEVDNWSTIQGTFNNKMDRLKSSVEVLGIAIGSALIPKVTEMASALLKVLQPLISFVTTHQTLTAVILGSLAAFGALVAVIALLHKTFTAVSNAMKDLKKGFDVLSGLYGKLTGQADAAGVSAQASADTQVTAQEEVQASVAETATAEETAAAESSGSWLTAAGSMIASSAKWVAAQLADLAKAVAEQTAAAARVLARWAVTFAGMIARGAVWVAEQLSGLAVVLAENIAVAATAAAAWIAANATMLLGIGAIVAAIAVAALLIIKYWHDIKQWALDAWHLILEGWQIMISGIERIAEDIFGFLKRNWQTIAQVIVALFIPGGIIIAAFWRWHDTIFKIGGDILRGVTGFFTQIGTNISNTLGDIVNWFGNLPGNIANTLSGLATWFYNLGVRIFNSIMSGIGNIGGSIWHSITSAGGSALSTLTGGLLAGGGPASAGRVYVVGEDGPEIFVPSTSGVVLPNNVFTAGIGSGSPLNLGSGGGGTVVIQNTLDLRGSQVMTERDMDTLVNKVGRALATNILPSGGLRVTM